MDDLLDELWAIDAREKIEQWIQELNAGCERVFYRVVWGFKDNDEAQREATRIAKGQRGLLSRGVTDYEIEIFNSHADYGGARYVFTQRMNRIRFPSDPRAIFNLLMTRMGNASLDYEPAFNPDGIESSSASVWLYVNECSPAILNNALTALSEVISNVEALIAEEPGSNHWQSRKND